MGIGSTIWKWLTWRRDTTPKEELERIDGDIREAEAALGRLRAGHARIARLLLLILGVVELPVLLVAAVLVYASAEPPLQLYAGVAVAAVPGVWYVLSWLAASWYRFRGRRARRALSQLQAEQRQLIDGLLNVAQFRETIQLIRRYAPPETLDEFAPLFGLQPTAASTMRRRKPSATPAAAVAKAPAATSSPYQQPKAAAATGAGTASSAVPVAVSRMGGRVSPPATPRSREGIPVPRQEVRDLQPAEMATPASGGLLDRVVNWLVGETAEQLVAVRCARCNVLYRCVPPQERESLAFTCPVCQHWNPTLLESSQESSTSSNPTPPSESTGDSSTKSTPPIEDEDGSSPSNSSPK